MHEEIGKRIGKCVCLTPRGNKAFTKALMDATDWNNSQIKKTSYKLKRAQRTGAWASRIEELESKIKTFEENNEVITELFEFLNKIPDCD